MGDGWVTGVSSRHLLVVVVRGQRQREICRGERGKKSWLGQVDVGLARVAGEAGRFSSSLEKVRRKCWGFLESGQCPR